MNKQKQQVVSNISGVIDGSKPMHHLEIGIKNPDSKQLLSVKKLTLRDRFLNTLFGNSHSMVVLLPGESVGTITITEIDRARK